MKVVHNSSATKEDIQLLGKFFAYKLAIIKMMTREKEARSPHQIDTPIHGRQLFFSDTCGMQECNKHFRFKQIGKAVSMIALPRRCLYHKLDFIIECTHLSLGTICLGGYLHSMSQYIQEPLTRFCIWVIGPLSMRAQPVLGYNHSG